MPFSEAKPFLITLLVLFLGLFLLVVSGFLQPVVLGLLLGGASYPTYTFLLRIFRGKNVTALFTVFLVSLLIILPSIGILTLLGREALTLFEAREEILFNENLVQTLDEFLAPLNIDFTRIFSERIIPIIQNLGTTILQAVGGLLSNAVNLILQFFIMLITLFYVLRDGKTFGKFLIDISPLHENDELLLYKTFKNTGGAIFYSSIITAIVQGFLGGIAFFFAGLNAPVLWGVMMAFLAFIPFLGPYLIFVPAAIYLLIINEPIVALIFLAYNVLIVSTVDNFLKPKLISGKVDLHPFFVLLMILGGLKIFGLIGIIYGPLIYAIFLALLKVYLEKQEPERTT